MEHSTFFAEQITKAQIRTPYFNGPPQFLDNHFITIKRTKAFLKED